MLQDIFKRYIYPIATLSGSIIGVGFLSLPYVATKVGIVAMLFYFIVLSAFVVFIHTIFAKISLATPDFRRWPGFVGYYFGSRAKKLILVLMVFGLAGTLLVYLIIGSQFLTALFSPLFGGGQLAYALIYFVLASALIFFGVRIISRFEFWALLLLFSCGLLIFFKGFSQIQFTNLTMLRFQPSYFFLPYGALMFSLWGTGLIPEVEEMLRGNKKPLKTVVMLGTLIPAFLYLLFTILIVGISGDKTTEASFIGLGEFLGDGIISVALFIGILTTFTAFITQGLLLKKVLTYDVGFPETLAWVITCIAPLAMFLLGINSFIVIIGFIGGVLLSVDGVLILLIYKKIGGKAWVVIPVIAFFIFMALYQIIFYLF